MLSSIRTGVDFAADTVGKARDKMRPMIAFDLGTEFSSAYVRGEGLLQTRVAPDGDKKGEINDELFIMPSVVRRENRKGQTVYTACGDEAFAMMDRTIEGDITLDRPIQDGRCVNQEAAVQLMRGLMRFSKDASSLLKSLGGKAFSPLVVVPVPHTTTPADRESMADVIKKFGGEPCLVSQAVSGAFGTTDEPADKHASMFTDWGATTIDTIVLFRNILSAKAGSFNGGGRFITEIIKQALEKEHDVQVSFAVAEQLKRELVALSGAKPLRESRKVRGRSRNGGVAREVNLTSAEITEWVNYRYIQNAEMLGEYISFLSRTLDTDLQDENNPIWLAGGASMPAGLPDLMKQVLPAFTFRRAQRAMVAGILGAGRMLENPDLLEIGKKALEYEIEMPQMHYVSRRVDTENSGEERVRKGNFGNA